MESVIRVPNKKAPASKKAPAKKKSPTKKRPAPRKRASAVRVFDIAVDDFTALQAQLRARLESGRAPS
jgi:hypothetical protein